MTVRVKVKVKVPPSLIEPEPEDGHEAHCDEDDSPDASDRKGGGKAGGCRGTSLQQSVVVGTNPYVAFPVGVDGVEAA